MINIGIGLKTFFKFIRRNAETGEVVWSSDWCGNTILTSGRNELSKRDWFSCVQVGTSSVAPNASQTTLQAYIGGSNTLITSDYGCASSAPYYGWYQKTFRFYEADGIANQNLNEVALGWSETTQTSIMARCLITDISGTPVTVTPLPGEEMDVLVEVRYYAPSDDVTGTVSVYGTTFDYIVRASGVTNSVLWAQFIGSLIDAYCANNSDWYATDGDIGTVLTGPDGIVANCDNNSEWNATYVENSYTRKFGITCGANGWNCTAGKLMRSLRIRTTAGAFQVQFDDQANPGFGMPKTNLSTLGVGFSVSWGEASPAMLTTIPTQNWTVSTPVTFDVDSYFNPEKRTPVTWSITSGALPTGLSLNTSTGEITGTPTTPGSGNVVINAVNDVDDRDTNVINWVVT